MNYSNNLPESSTITKIVTGIVCTEIFNSDSKYH